MSIAPSACVLAPRLRERGSGRAACARYHALDESRTAVTQGGNAERAASENGNVPAGGVMPLNRALPCSSLQLRLGCAGQSSAAATRRMSLHPAVSFCVGRERAPAPATLRRTLADAWPASRRRKEQRPAVRTLAHSRRVNPKFALAPSNPKQSRLVQPTGRALCSPAALECRPRRADSPPQAQLPKKLEPHDMLLRNIAETKTNAQKYIWLRLANVTLS